METSNNIKTAVIYCRISTSEQSDNGFSLAHQKETLEKYCESSNIKILRQFSEDFSGKDFNRPEFTKLLDYAKKNQNKIDALIFTRWDRFSRNLTETLIMVNKLKELGIEVVSTDQALDYSVSEHRLLLSMIMAIAEIEMHRDLC